MKTSYQCPYQQLCDAFEGSRRTQLLAELTYRYRWTQEKAGQVVDEYIMFLYIASLNIGVHLVPTQEIDYVWEDDILQSAAQYMQTCQTLCGHVIHHAGEIEIKKTHPAKNTAAAFTRTHTLFAQYFGKTQLSGGLVAAACGVL